MFAHMAWLLLYFTNDTAVVVTYALLAFTECYSCMRAGADVNEIRDKKLVAGGSSMLVDSVLAVEVVSSGGKSNKERDGRSGTVPYPAIGNGHDTGHSGQHRQYSLFEGDETK